MANRWETSDSVWLEDERNGQFELAQSRGISRIEWQAHARGRLPDVAQLLGASEPACGHGSIYPEGFVYCPECGAPLRMHGGSHLPPWWGPSTAPLSADAYPLPKYLPLGLPLTAQPLAAALETRKPEPEVGTPDEKIPAPPNAVCVFAAGNFGYAAQRLLALAYTRNVLQYWDPLARRWHLMAAEGTAADLSFTASAYAWLPAAAGQRGEVGIVPGAHGLARLIVNPVNESYRTETLLSAPLASSPGMAAGRIACLLAAPAGVRLWTANADGADGETLEIVAVAAHGGSAAGSVTAGDIPDPDDDAAMPGNAGPAAPAAHAAIPATGWSRPVSYDGKLVWLHELGEIWWHPGSAPQWLPWPAGWSPRLQFGGPVRSRDGRLWLIGHDGQRYSYRELGAAGAQIQPLDGARLGFCTLLFRRGHQVKDEPWAVENVEDQGGSHDLVLPLLENASSTRAQPTGLVLRVEAYSGKAEAALEDMVLPRVQIEWVGQRNVILDEAVRLKQPTDCQPFVYDNCLWLHHPSWNDMRGWRLEAQS
ncbi:hypothetical protein GCM10027277_20370 [Pseudoduganella ginsengisoli]|uniref:Uncharacterized protein n=1 Tax=Pseudoduganella ginsengisoli TaxID=1462440 RepID=A0A6L6PTE4_9BURK|nr:zinc ribbon domain-containing protein [Pseudoduganella ginsengisoli]MTW00707.1 hypothetical protein [Pseudoduganella ginsengisoli]